MEYKEKILTKNPYKTMIGRNINKEKYDIIKKAILQSLKNKVLTHTQLENSVKKNLNGKFQGSIAWYNQVVKRDLEACKIIKRITNQTPNLYKLNRR